VGKQRDADAPGLLALIAPLLALALCALSPAGANRAAREGAAMAAARQPYTVRPWVLWDARDPLRAVHARADLDAVIVETPYERVRYEAYMERLQALPVTPAWIEGWRRAASGKFGFIVYAHSRGEANTEQRFLAAFSPATVALSDGTRLTSTERVIFGPSPDFYTVGTFREQRWTGSLTYRFPFPLDTCKPKGTLAFADGLGRRYRFPFDLSKYR
jgi:hypothetical protein